jgi:diguanylate cyclase (GGDEF)-like protein
MRKTQKYLFFTRIILIGILLVGNSSFIEYIANAVDQPKYKIIIGSEINYPPYSYLDSKGNPAGFDIDLSKAVGAAMGYEVEIRMDEWSKIRKALDDGEIDAIAGMFFSKEREKDYSFSLKHNMASGDIFTKKNVKLEKLEDLKNKTVVVQKADIVGEYLKSLGTNIRVVEVPTVSQALKLLENGTYDYAGLLKLPGLYIINADKLIDLKAQGMMLVPNNYCMVVKRGNENELSVLNGGLQIIKATGEYQKIYDKWLNVYDEKNLSDYLVKYKILFIILISILLGFVCIFIMLKHMVNKRTQELKKANSVLQMKQEELAAVNSEMEASIEEIVAMEEELKDQYSILVENEQLLRKSEERSKAVINALPDVIFIVDGEGVFLDCQASKYEELPMPKEAFVGKKINEVLSPKIVGIAHEKIREAILTKELQSFEHETYINNKRQIHEIRIINSRENEVICISRNISADAFYRERIEYLSYHDQLTGLFNRRYFEEELKRLDVQRNYPLCLIMADVNGLKLVNDSFGHITGDQLLVKVAEILKKACRSDEIISRIGGDEFVILIPKMGNSHAESLVERIIEISEKEKIGSIEMSISLGWELKYDDGENIQEIFNKAEDHMYKKKLFESPSIRGKTIGAIINTLYEKNKREELHSHRVSELCRRLAIALGFSDQEVEEIKTVGLFHDIGKIAINEGILNRPGKLTAEEFDEIKKHSEIGYRILNSVNDMNDMADFVLYHHERWDGRGYPRGLKGQAIPMQSRMISIADTYDAITSDRSYRRGSSDKEAILELRKHSGTQFDPDLVEPFIQDVLGYKNLVS